MVAAMKLCKRKPKLYFFSLKRKYFPSKTWGAVRSPRLWEHISKIRTDCVSPLRRASVRLPAHAPSLSQGVWGLRSQTGETMVFPGGKRRDGFYSKPQTSMDRLNSFPRKTNYFYQHSHRMDLPKWKFCFLGHRGGFWKWSKTPWAPQTKARVQLPALNSSAPKIAPRMGTGIISYGAS